MPAAHTCHANGCTVPVPEHMFACSRHWFMLPKEYRDAIWREYAPGQEITKTPSRAYLKVAGEAIRWLSQQEGRGTDRAAPASTPGLETILIDPTVPDEEENAEQEASRDL